jgi:hypothetical protein
MPLLRAATYGPATPVALPLMRDRSGHFYEERERSVRNLTLGLVVVAAVALAGCTSNSATPAPAAETVAPAVETVAPVAGTEAPAAASVAPAGATTAPAVETVAPEAVETALPAESPAA